MMGLEPATPAFADALALVHAACFPPGERWGADALSLQLGLPGAFGFVSAEGGFVLARVAADEAEILTLAVDPAIQRRGLGRRLIERAAARAGERGATAMFLEVAASNAPAQALYASCGFTVVGHRPRYYANGTSALVLRAPIPFGSSPP